MTDKEKKARLVIDSAPHDNPSNFVTIINMGNFCNNTQDMVFVDVDYMSPVTMSTTTVQSATSNAVYNAYDAIEVLIDFPQQDSYDTTSQCNTYHICMLERDTAQPPQTMPYTNTTDILFEPAMRQTWKFKHKPSHIVMRPEVLQQKSATVKLQLLNKTVPVYNGNLNAYSQDNFNS